ncbi:hypothetical protein AB0J86_18850 [Micromonospora sp. NPDC049559]|uniref:hypothetical protein n=1 Tax=Micromonospora sp. NPDC049559 TaxID=3155923 RepID=UPI00344865BE
MIPTLVLFGLVFGRWWRSALVAAAAGWPLLLVVTGDAPAGPGLLAGAALAVVNTGVGVLVHQGLRLAVGRARRSAGG